MMVRRLMALAQRLRRRLIRTHTQTLALPDNNDSSRAAATMRDAAACVSRCQTTLTLAHLQLTATHANTLLKS